jgi:hypothetical protein
MEVRSRETRMPSTAVDLAGLRRLYGELAQQNAEAARLARAGLHPRPGQSHAEFKQEQAMQDALFETACIVFGSRGERNLLTQMDEINAQGLPSNVQGILLDTGFRARLAMGQDLANRASIYFDFKRTSLFDLSNVSGEPTPNDSNYRLDAQNAGWAARTTEIFEEFLSNHRLHTGWLHARYTYDFALILVGIPMALWAAFRVGQWVDASVIGDALLLPTAVRVYLFLVTLYGFRILFGVVRWIWPCALLQEPRQNPGRAVRAFVGVIAASVVVSFIVDGIRVLL